MILINFLKSAGLEKEIVFVLELMLTMKEMSKR